MTEFISEELTSWWMLLSLAYLALIALRLFALIRDSLGGQGANLVAGAFIVFLVFAFFAGGGGAILLVSFVLLLIIIGTFTTAVGGFAAGFNLKTNPFTAIPSVLLLVCGFVLGFLEPMLGNPIFVVLLGLNMFVMYKLRGDFLGHSFGSDSFLSYLFVWPPMILLLTFSELMLLPALLSPPWHGIAIGVLTALSATAGWFSSEPI